MRAIAAILVVLFHASEIVHRPFHWGGFGVDLFFVISGFIMFAITDELSRPWAFLKDRILRIVPLYWLATIVLIVWQVLVAHSDWPSRDLIWSSLFFLPLHRNSHGAVLPLLPLGWTLNYEMMFYCVFALTLFLPRRFQLPALTLVFAALVAAGAYFRPSSPAFSFWTHPIILQFLAGAWLARFRSPGCHRRRRLGWILIAAGLVLFVGRHSLFSAFGPDWPWHRIPSGICALLFVAGALYLEPGAKAGRLTRWTAGLGDASYSIYIWQLSIILFVLAVSSKIGPPSWLLFLVLCVSCVAGGWILYWLIERPLMNLFRRRLRRRGMAIPAGP